MQHSKKFLQNNATKLFVEEEYCGEVQSIEWRQEEPDVFYDMTVYNNVSSNCTITTDLCELVAGTLLWFEHDSEGEGKIVVHKNDVITVQHSVDSLSKAFKLMGFTTEEALDAISIDMAIEYDIGTDGSLNEIKKMLPSLDEPISCPHEKCPDTAELWYTIVHLNDDHAWSRESIADWLDTLDIDLTFPIEGEENDNKD